MRWMDHTIPDEELDVKSLIRRYGLDQDRLAEHKRLHEIFKAAGLLVFTIQRSLHHPLWQVKVKRPQGCDARVLKREVKKRLCSAGIRLKSHDPIICPFGDRLSLWFLHDFGTPGRGLIFFKRCQGVLQQCEEEYLVLPGD